VETSIPLLTSRSYPEKGAPGGSSNNDLTRLYADANHNIGVATMQQPDKISRKFVRANNFAAYACGLPIPASEQVCLYPIPWLSS
jgi:hypothetical protein